jgi:hypothetical protein
LGQSGSQLNQKQAMKNLLIPTILAHSLAIRIAFLFPVFRIAIASLLVAETLLLIAFGGFSQTWDDRQKLYLILMIAGFFFAILGGI